MTSHTPDYEQLIRAANGLFAPDGSDPYESTRRQVEVQAALINLGQFNRAPYVNATMQTYRPERVHPSQ